MTKDTPSGRDGGPPSLRDPHQPSQGSRGNGSRGRPPQPHFHEDHRQEREALRAELEAERLRSKEAWHRFTVEVRELREAAERDRQLLADQLHSKWEQQRAREIQQLKEETKRLRESEIRQLLRWKEAELREAQELLQRERDAAMRHMRDLQRQLAKELVSHGSSSSSRGTRGGSSGAGLSAECSAKLEEVLGQLRWEVDGDQASRIRHLEAELDLERRLFLKYILESFEGEHLLAWPLHRFAQVSPPPETKVNCWRAAGEPAGGGLSQQGRLTGGGHHQLKKQDAGLLNARKVLEERCTHLAEPNLLLRKKRSPDVQDNMNILKGSGELAGIVKQLDEAAEKLQESKLRVSSPPGPLDCSDRELCEQQAKHLYEQDSVLLAKDPPTEVLQVCQELQAKLPARKEDNALFNSSGFDGWLQESQRGVLRLRRPRKLQSPRDCFQYPRVTSNGSLSSVIQEASSTIHGRFKASLAKKKPKTWKTAKREADALVLPLGNGAKSYKNSTLKTDSKNKPQLQLPEKQLVEERKLWGNLRHGVEEKESYEVERKRHKILREDALTCSNSSGSESMQNSSKPGLNPEDIRGQLEEWEADKVCIRRPSDNRNPFKICGFLARYSYDPFSGPNQNPEAELPLTAGEYVYICGGKDEDGFYVGELMDGRRGFVPSNLVEEVAGDELFSFVPLVPRDVLNNSALEPDFSCPNAGHERKRNCPDEDEYLSLLSDGAEGTLWEGQAASPHPQSLSLLNLQNVTATSAQITWFPGNHNHTHLVYLNEEKHEVTNAGMCCYTFQNLRPSSQYRVQVEALVLQEDLVYLREGLWRKSAEMLFMTPSAGPPHAPLDVHVQADSSADVLVISWLPETIHPSGSSNGVRVTGYGIYISGRKVTEIMSPTAGCVSLNVSQINTRQGPQTVSVRTVSPFGESADSVPALIPSSLREVPSTALSQSVIPETTSKEFLES
ncbi:RIMS-binding protein 3C-like [Paroedura picta]|uniref:RIMS-binding protein 3C-like n=1 Tax=Paroedura picta TaxID=143630 RepID=UPI004055A7F3